VPAFELQPRGMTALLDAIGRTVTEVREHIDSLPPAKTPDEVVMVILTDGHENASQEFTREQIKTLIEERTAAGWKLVFMGADQDAFTVAAGMGIRAGSTLSYASKHTTASFAAAGSMVARGTESGLYAFSGDERAAAGDDSDATGPEAG
jgi:Mg-chelatase subunit ChlD